MNQTDTPAKVASNDRLGPLPEYAHEFSPRWFGDDGGFTGAQMRLYALAAVAAEQKRWADGVAGMAKAAADNNDLRVYELLRGLNDALYRA